MIKTRQKAQNLYKTHTKSNIMLLPIICDPHWMVPVWTLSLHHPMPYSLRISCEEALTIHQIADMEKQRLQLLLNVSNFMDDNNGQRRMLAEANNCPWIKLISLGKYKSIIPANMQTEIKFEVYLQGNRLIEGYHRAHIQVHT